MEDEVKEIGKGEDLVETMGYSMDFEYYSKKSPKRLWLYILNNLSGCCIDCSKRQNRNREASWEDKIACQGRDDGVSG